MPEQTPGSADVDAARDALTEAYDSVDPSAPQVPGQNGTVAANQIMDSQPTAGDGSTPVAEHAAQFGPPAPGQLAEYGQGLQPPAGQPPEQLPPQPH